MRQPLSIPTQMAVPCCPLVLDIWTLCLAFVPTSASRTVSPAVLRAIRSRWENFILIDFAAWGILPSMVPAVTTTGLTRHFGDFTAVQDVNLTVAPGQFFGFLGPNGAGKSTTIKMLTGLLAPTSGSIQILGLNAITNPIEVKRQIGVVPEGLALFGRLTATEYLRFVGRMYGLDLSTTTNRTTELLEFMGLASETKKLITDYSHGMQKKLALAAAVIHGPKVLFLDEPFEGVDAIASGTLKTMLQGMIARGATIFLTSHVLEIVERLCTHIAIIDRGRLIADGSLEELRAGVHARSSSSADTHTLTLEQIFLDIVGEQEGNHRDPNGTHPEQELSWLG
jgi:ABC-2 type transport system ATP-binding protein